MLRSIVIQLLPDSYASFIADYATLIADCATLIAYCAALFSRHELVVVVNNQLFDSVAGITLSLRLMFM